MKISDRAVGYFSLLALLCIIAGVSYGMYAAHHEKLQTALVDFDELGTLQPEDVVVIRGYRVGTIGKVIWLGDRSRVQVKFDEPITIREGTQFNNINYALMGQRRLEIIPSKTGKVLPDSFIHTGHFEPGIAEALRFMEDVREQVMNVREAVLLFANGDSTHASVQQKYEEAIGYLENLLENVDVTISTVQPKIKNVFSQVQDASNTLINATYQADSTVNAASRAVNAKLEQAEDIIRTLSEGTAKASETIAALEKTPAMDALLNSHEAIDKANKLIEKLDKLIAAIDTKGIKMYDDNGKPVKLFTWKNTNLIGKTAREKAWDRAEKGEKLPD